MIPDELRANGFTRWPMRAPNGYDLYVRLGRVGNTWLVVWSDFNGPVGWHCEVYSSKIEWDAHALPIQTVEGFTFVEDLIRELWRRRLI